MPPRKGRSRGSGAGATSKGRGKGKVSSTRGRASTASRPSKARPWEAEDDDYVVDYASDIDDEDEADTSKEKDVFDFDNVEDDVDLDACDSNKINEDPDEVDDVLLCPWIELPAPEIPLLELPSSSRDLPLQSNLLMEALQVYEVCRSFHRSLYISPFLFEDLCAALTVTEHNALLADLHISLFKTMLRDDDEENVAYAATDTNNAFNILVQLLEPMTYAEVIRQYAESDACRVPAEVLRLLSESNYPFVNAEQRILVLSWLCDRFLHSQVFRKIAKNDGRITMDDKCRDCNRPGDLLPCDNCEAAYHLDCASMADVPDGQWLCAVCEVHRVRGVVDCLPLGEQASRQPLRMQPIGFDRHGRTYWFIARRVFVQDRVSDEVYYYSTAPQLHELLTRLDSLRLEQRLCRIFRQHLPVIVEQMSVTMELTNERREELIGSLGKRGLAANVEHAYLHMDNLNRISEIVAECFERTSGVEITKEELEREQAVYDDENEELPRRIERMMGIVQGTLLNTFWSGGVDQEQVLLHKEEKEGSDEDMSTAFRLGYTDKGYRGYKNHYAICDFAKPNGIRVKERDKKKYMAGRFSLVDEGHFEWSLAKGKDLFGNEVLAIKYMEWMINRMHRRIPLELMHRGWPRALAKFNQMLSSAKSMAALRECLLLLECGMRKTLFHPQWWNSLGCTRFLRQTSEQREEKSKEEQRRKKTERELLTADADDDSIVWVKYTKLGGPPKHNIWRLKDEQFRVNGIGALGGWSWRSSTAVSVFQLPPRHNSNDAEWKKRSSRLGGIVDAIVKQREQVETEKRREMEGPSGCFSPSCQNAWSTTSSCYSVRCRLQARRDAAAVEKERKAENDLKRSRELGSQVPYPMPSTLRFTTRKHNKMSIFVLQDRYLRRLARQGGLIAALWFPGFNRTAKSNLTVWNYPCYRPLFDHCWRYNTMRVRSLHGLAVQLRLLWACVKWSEFTPDDSNQPMVIVHLADRDEERTVVDHKEMPPDGLYERYEVSLRIIPIDGDLESIPDYDNDSEKSSSTSSRRGDSSRKRKSALRYGATASRSSIAEPRHVWVDGVDLKLWEIRAYWEERARLEARLAAVKARRQEATSGMIHPSPIRIPLGTQSNGSAKKPRYDLSVMDTSSHSMRRTAAGKEFIGGQIRGGGGKAPAAYIQQRESGAPRVVVVNSTERETDPSGSTTSPPVARFPSTSGPRSMVRASGGNVVKVPSTGKVIMIRRPDGSTQLIQAVKAVNPAIDDATQQPRYSGITEDGRRIVTTVAGGQGGFVGAQPARLLRIQPPKASANPIRSVSAATFRTEDPFMRRMAVEKAVTGMPVGGRRPVPAGLAGGSAGGSGSGDIYATYYGESSNEAIDVAAYQELASRGYRPPGRPPGRLASTFGYSPKTQQRLIPRTQMYSGASVTDERMSASEHDYFDHN